MVLALPDWFVNSYPAEHETLYLITRPAFDAVVRQPIKQSGIADKALTNISISLERTGSRNRTIFIRIHLKVTMLF